jgi:hypothetical protein
MIMRAAVAVVALFALSAPAAAQPMMMDPSKMSGIPRPDPQVPAGTITVRLIRGELANRMTDHAVELVDGAGKAKQAKTDAEGRATFAGLSPGDGPFRARAKDGPVEETSQEIALPTDMGVRVMLVFPRDGKSDGGPAADGIARPDKAIPSGTLIVHVQDESGAPKAGVPVALGHARQGEDVVRELKGKTDANGDAKFEGLDAKPNSGYLAEAIGETGARFASKPFRLVENMGSRVILEARAVTKDVRALQIGRGSHFVFEVVDEAVQVMEVWRLSNLGTAPVDAPGGIHIPLPSKAVQIQLSPSAPPNLSVSGHDVVWKGPLPVGDTEVQVVFALAYKGARLEIEQPAPIEFTEVNVIVERVPGLTVESEAVRFGPAESQDVQGRAIQLFRGTGVPAGGTIRFRLVGLPHADTTWRLVAAAVAVALLVGFIGYGLAGKRGGSTREALEKERERLLDELVALDAAAAGNAKSGGKQARRRAELVAELTRVYRELDLEG